MKTKHHEGEPPAEQLSDDERRRRRIDVTRQWREEFRGLHAAWSGMRSDLHPRIAQAIRDACASMAETLTDELEQLQGAWGRPACGECDVDFPCHPRHGASATCIRDRRPPAARGEAVSPRGAT